MSRAGHVLKLVGEFRDFARENKAYWLTPLALMVLTAGVIIIASGGATPFIYILF